MIKTAKSGYTIVEVLIVLAISTSLLFAAIAVFKGQQGETQFTQAVQDFNSKIINYANQVSAGTFPDSGNYSCTPHDSTSNPPTFDTTGGGLGGRQGCIFLGRAMQAVQGSSNINIYTVVGNQLDNNGNSANSITDSQPTAATISSPSFQFILADTYSIPYNAAVQSVKAYNAGGTLLAGDWYMSGFYTSLDASADNVSGGTQMNLYGYSLPHNAAPQSLTVKNCIETASPCSAGGFQPISRWLVCVQNADNTKKFGLSISGTTQGIITQIQDGTC